MESEGRTRSLVHECADRQKSAPKEERHADAPSRAVARAAQLREMAGRLGQELHAVAVRLRPRVLDDFGLETALTSYAEDWSRQHAIPLDVHARTEGARLSRELESAIYRIAQEALTNVARHSEASRASLVVERRDGHLHLIVEDDGQGFEPAEASTLARGEPGLGLLGIKERAALLNGTVEIESSPEAGTSIFVRLPIVAEAPSVPPAGASER